MSARQEVQDKIEKHLLDNIKKWNAPYGVITGLRPFGRGKCRTITFGVAAYLDAEIVIYNVDNISINGQGALAYKYVGHFTSVDNVIKKLEL